MNPLLISRGKEVAGACRRYAVERLEAFGSVTRADFDEGTSDIDLIVRFSASDQPGLADRYFDLAETLEGILGRRVDLVTERSLRNPEFLRSIAADRVTVYAA